VLVCAAKLRAMAAHVYSRSSRSLIGAGDSENWAAEWALMEKDILRIAAADSAQHQARVTSRMHRAYLVFRS
jgi:hypothetical protein